MYACMYVLVSSDVRPFNNPLFGSGRQPFQYSAEGAAAPYVEVPIHCFIHTLSHVMMVN